MSELIPPVKEGDEIEVVIISTGKEKDGVAKVSGFTVFVPHAAVGETVRIRIKRVLKTYAFAEVVTDKEEN